MAETDPSYVQVAVDSTGKKMRNVQIGVMQPDGSVAITQMEVVSIADDQGNILNFDGIEAVIKEQQRTNELLEAILGVLT